MADEAQWSTFYRVDEAAKLAGYSRRRFVRILEEQRISPILIGRKYFLLAVDIKRALGIDGKKEADSFHKSVLLGPDGQPLTRNDPTYKRIVMDFTSVNYELLRILRKAPHLFYEISPRKFEEVVAEVFLRKGYDVKLTPISKDGGKDVYAGKQNDIGVTCFYIVECKQRAPDNKIGVHILRDLYGVVEAERATAGILATTSFFTTGAKEFQKQVEFRIGLRDFGGIQSWLDEILG
jgi:restriction system protein